MNDPCEKQPAHHLQLQASPSPPSPSRSRSFTTSRTRPHVGEKKKSFGNNFGFPTRVVAVVSGEVVAAAAVVVVVVAAVVAVVLGGAEVVGVVVGAVVGLKINEELGKNSHFKMCLFLNGEANCSPNPNLSFFLLTGCKTLSMSVSYTLDLFFFWGGGGNLVEPDVSIFVW